MADSNPANFANLPKDQLKDIAAKGGHASHGSSNKENEVRSFQFYPHAQLAGTECVVQPRQCGLWSKSTRTATPVDEFCRLRLCTPASGSTMLTSQQSHADRNPDGTFTKGSELAKELGAKGGHVAHEHQVEKEQVETDGVCILRSMLLR